MDKPTFDIIFAALITFCLIGGLRRIIEFRRLIKTYNEHIYSVKTCVLPQHQDKHFIYKKAK